jgi:hypothetical protein
MDREAPDAACERNQMRELTITIPDEKPPSWNTYYSGKHWTSRQAMAKQKHMLVRAYLDPDMKPFDRPVDIVMTLYSKARPMDADNLCAKLYVDGLVGWVVEDDSPKYIASVTTRSRVDKKDPRLEIYVRESD